MRGVAVAEVRPLGRARHVADLVVIGIRRGDVAGEASLREEGAAFPVLVHAQKHVADGAAGGEGHVPGDDAGWGGTGAKGVDHAEVRREFRVPAKF